MKKLVVRVPIAQTQFFELVGPHGGLFVNILWNWGKWLEVDPQTVVQLVTNSQFGNLIIAKRLSEDEWLRFHKARTDGDQEAFSRIIQGERLRWR